MSISKIYHNDTEIVHIDYTWCKTKEDTISQLEKVFSYVSKQEEKVILLVDFTGVYGSPEYMKKSKSYGDFFKRRTTKSAVIGMTSLKILLLKGYNRVTGDTIEPFKTREEALEWLTS